MDTSICERDITPRTEADIPTPFFQVTEIKTKPILRGVAVKVTFQSGVSLYFDLDPAQSVSLVEGIATVLQSYDRTLSKT